MSKTSEENPIDLDYKEHSTTFLNYFFLKIIKIKYGIFNQSA